MARKRRPLSILLAVLRMLLNHPAHRVNFPVNDFAFGVAGHFFFGQARISCLKILRQFPDGRLPFFDLLQRLARSLAIKKIVAGVLIQTRQRQRFGGVPNKLVND